MRRSWAAVAVVGALALVAGALAVMALRPAPVVPAQVAQPELGAVAIAGDAVVRWAGPSACNAEADATPVERSVDGGAWEASQIPLAGVHDLSFADGRHGVATGTTAGCTQGVAVTSDGGRTWSTSPRDPVLLDAWYVGARVWAVQRVLGAPQVAAFVRAPDGRLRPDPAVSPSRPCSAADGELDQVAFWDAERGLLLCQNAVVSSLLVARTTNAAESFEALTDDRPELGLDSTTEITGMDVAGDASVWMLFAGGAGADCPEGQLRYSDSEGAAFASLPCPRRSLDVDEVLDVSFSTDTDGVMLAVRNRATLMATTTDGGATWTERP